MFFGVQLPWCNCVGLNDGIKKAFLAFEKQVAEASDLVQLNTSESATMHTCNVHQVFCPLCVFTWIQNCRRLHMQSLPCCLGDQPVLKSHVQKNREG
jgi:hypothetical protein